MSDGPEWFAPKRYGYGAGLPVKWQGWALLIGFIVAISLATVLIRYSLVAYLSIFAILMTSFLVICARTTKGGWHWRDGGEE